MFRGTTTIIEMNLDIDTSLIEKMYVTFVQKNDIKFEKEACDCSFNGTTASVQLTQEETLGLTAGEPLKVQVRCKLTDGSVIASKVEVLRVEDVFNEEVI